MKLESFRVTEYKCINDTGQVGVNDITCLVGKNEAGKTAILEALYKLMPIQQDQGKFDTVTEYPRSQLTKYELEIQKGDRQPAIVIEAIYLLDSEDLQQVKSDFGDKVLIDESLTLSKGYNNTLYISLNLDEEVLTNSFINRISEPSIKSEVENCKTISELTEGLKKYASDPSVTQINNLLKQLLDKGKAVYFYDTYFQKRVPKFLYFDEYYLMEGQVNIESLKQRQSEGKLHDSDLPFLGLLELSQLNLDALINTKRTEELLSRLEGTSNYITNRIMNYWSQNKYLEIEFDLRPAKPADPLGMREGTNLLARIRNTKHKVTTPFGTRSRGFLWFFSFLSFFTQQKNKGERLILLLDEPGLFLHAKAQEDLLQFMEKELLPLQVIYTTHSPFMIDPRNFSRVRIVEDKSMESTKILPPEEEGTKVFTEVLEASADSLFPLQGALGYDITQTLFIGPNSLIVEGPSDLLYIRTISTILERKHRTGLSSKWTITPVGGADKVPTFVALIGAQHGMKLATLIDIKQKDVQKIENLYKSKLLKKNHVLTFGDFTGANEADIEDFFESDFYLKLVNEEYKNELNNTILETSLDNNLPRILARVEKYFVTNPLKGGNKFNHYRPARYLTENISSLEKDISKGTLDKFEEAFKALNALL